MGGDKMLYKLKNVLISYGEHGNFQIINISMNIATINKNGKYYGRFDANKNTFVD